MLNSKFCAFYKVRKIVFIIIALGIWINVYQNYNYLERQTVYVQGGYIDADISGTVEIDNTIDVNLSKINGYEPTTYEGGLLGVYNPH